MKKSVKSYFLFKLLFFFIVFTFCFPIAKKYQFQGENVPDGIKDVLLIFDDFVLELNEDGFFYNVENNSKEIEIQKKKEIEYTIEYQDKTESKKISLNSNTISIDLSAFQSDEQGLKEITKTRAKKAKSIPASKFSVSQEEARRIPGAGNDILRSVVALPGVQGTADANGEIYIRGSDKDDIYYSINSIRISNPLHSMSFYSAIPNILISSLNIYLGGFDSQFYNSQGGVIQVVTKKLAEYPTGKVQAEAELGLSIAGLNVNIPILKNLRLNLGIRRSYYEVLFAIAGALANNSLQNSNNTNRVDFSNIRPYFFDSNIFLDWDINKNHKLKIFTIFSDDGFLIKFPPLQLPNTITTNDANEQVIQSNSMNIGMDTYEAWNVQAVEYTFENKKNIENLLSVYRYSVTNNTSINGRQLSFFVRDQYAVKDDLKFLFSDNLTFSFGVFLNLEIATISIFDNEEGIVKPKADDYALGHDEMIQFVYQNPILYSIVSLANGITTGFGDDSFLENYKKFENDYSNYNANLKEIKTKPTRFQMSGYAAGDYSPITNLLIHAGVNSTFNTYSKKFSFDPRLNLSYFLFNQYTFSFKTGIYSQLPDLYLKESYTVNPEDGLAIIQRLVVQQDNLKTPYSYHVNLGVNTSFLNIFEASIDGYFKYMADQILINPTFDSKYPVDLDSNPRSINAGKGIIYGADIFIKQRFFKGNFGWLSYSWTKSSRYRFIENSYAFVGTDPENNGSDYKNSKMGWVAFPHVSEHTFRLVYSLTPNKKDIFGLRAEVSSGLPYTPKVIDKRYTKKNGTVLWSVRDGKLYSKNYPWKWKVDFRYDRIMFKFFGAQIGYFVDASNLEKYLSFLAAPTYSYSLTEQFDADLRSAQDGEGPLKDFKDGDAIPDKYYIDSAKKTGNVIGLLKSLPPLTTIGLIIRY